MQRSPQIVQRLSLKGLLHPAEAGQVLIPQRDTRNVIGIVTAARTEHRGSAGGVISSVEEGIGKAADIWDEPSTYSRQKQGERHQGSVVAANRRNPNSRENLLLGVVTPLAAGWQALQT